MTAAKHRVKLAKWGFMALLFASFANIRTRRSFNSYRLARHNEES